MKKSTGIAATGGHLSGWRDADIDRSSDVPSGTAHMPARKLRPRLSASSVGSHGASSTMPPPAQPASRLQSIHDDECLSAHSSRRTKSRVLDDRLSAKSGRTRAGMDRSDAVSLHALSSHSRVLWSSTASTRTESASDARSRDRIAHWREQHVQALEQDARAANKKSRKSMDHIPSQRYKQGREEPSISSETPLRCLLRYLAHEDLQDSIWWLGLLLACLLRALVGLGGWSGRGKPPMYGDFEAQRHWMELTWHLPTGQWYRHDLPYWGLDYPPLTAWTSWLCAWVALWFVPLQEAFALFTSRGDESSAVVVFMRLSVLALDVLLYLPSLAWFLSRRLETRSIRVRHIALLTAWFQPALILIDHGHFQYNNVMLGLAALSFTLLQSKLPNVHASITGPAVATAELQRLVLDTLSRHISLQYVLAAVFFSMSLCFKQMALYYAPAVFAIMLGRCAGLMQCHWLRGLALLAGLGGATLGTFALLFLPWLPRRAELKQVGLRIFPLARGLFEDKVANIWCALSVLPVGPRWKLQRMFGVETLAKMSLLTVLLAILPCCILLFMASVESVRRELIMDDAQAEQVVAKVRRRAGSVASGVSHRMTPSVRGENYARSAHDSSRGSDRHSVASGSLFGGSTSTLMRDAGPHRTRPPTSIKSTSYRTSVTPSPAADLLPYTLVSTSMAFFLFGFQTHEKSILLPLLPLTLIMTARGDRTGAGAVAADWEWAVLANNVGMFSMWPLLLRDGQGLAWWVLLLLWNGMLGYRPWEALRSTRATFVAWLSAAVHAGMLLLMLAQASVAVLPPHASGWLSALFQRYPDLFPVLNVLLCMPVFMLVWLWSLKKHVEITLASGVLVVTKSIK